jgi:hypothetical protein
MTEEVIWKGEGRVLPLTRCTSDSRLFAIARVKNYLMKLKQGREVVGDDIVAIMQIIKLYIENPAIRDMRKGEWEFDEKQMRELGWSQEEIDRAFTRFNDGTKRMLERRCL